MKNLMYGVFIALLMNNLSFANEASEISKVNSSYFEIRADGLACPYCAYGIEKKFMAIEGVKEIDVDLKKGLVKVNGTASLKFEEKQLKTLFTDSGFTFRSMKKIER